MEFCENYSGGMPYVLRKGGFYYAHHDSGYVSRIEMAEIYDKDYAINYASQHEDITAIPISDYLKNPDALDGYLARMEVMRDALLKALEETK